MVTAFLHTSTQHQPKKRKVSVQRAYKERAKSVQSGPTTQKHARLAGIFLSCVVVSAWFTFLMSDGATTRSLGSGGAIYSQSLKGERGPEKADGVSVMRGNVTVLGGMCVFTVYIYRGVLLGRH